MGTLNEKLEYLSQTKEYIKEAIISKGQEVSSSDTFRSYASKISAIDTVNNEDPVTVTPTTSSQTVTPDQNHTGLSSVTVSGVTSAIDANIQAGNIKKDVQILGVTGTLEDIPAVVESLSITPSTSSQTFTPTIGVDGYAPVTVSAVDSTIDQNITAGNIKKDVEILGVTGSYEGASINNQNKSIISDGSYTADQGYTGLGTVTVTAGAVAAQEVENETSEQLMLINDGEVELTVTVSPTDANLTITSVANSVDITPTSSSSGVYTFNISSLSTRSYTYSASATGYTTATGTIAGGTTTSTITLVAENNSSGGID